MASIYTFTYRVETGRVQSFRCAATSADQAVALWADERAIVRKVTGGSVTPIKVEVA